MAPWLHAGRIRIPSFFFAFVRPPPFVLGVYFDLPFTVLSLARKVGVLVYPKTFNLFARKGKDGNCVTISDVSWLQASFLLFFF